MSPKVEAVLLRVQALELLREIPDEHLESVVAKLKELMEQHEKNPAAPQEAPCQLPDTL